MVGGVISLAARHRALVLLVVGALVLLGVRSLGDLRLDALPDLSDVQVIVVTEHAGQSSEVIESQVTRPLTTALLGVPGAKTVRGFSMYELSFVYVLFEDGTDIYWARSRVSEQLEATRTSLPAGVRPRLGPDATGVGWVYQYVLFPGYYCGEYPNGIWHHRASASWYEDPRLAPAAQRGELRFVHGFEHPGKCPIDGLVLERSFEDLVDLRRHQDALLRAPLTAVPGVSEIASFGGFQREFQVVVDPIRLQAFGVALPAVVAAIERSNADVGASVIEWSEMEYMVRARGRLSELADLGAIPVARGPGRSPVPLRELATLAEGASPRRGVGELNGVGEAVGGIVVARFGENAHQVIGRVKDAIEQLTPGLPPGVIVLPTYDRSQLIDEAVSTLWRAVLEELAIVAAICLLFLAHFRSSLVILLTLPAALLLTVLAMQVLGMNANIMSLAGLALAIGVMVDSSLVMVENANRAWASEMDRPAEGRRSRSGVVIEAAREVGPSLFASLLVMAVAFLPILFLGGESGRLFRPLAYTKTFAMVAAAVLGISLVPVLMTLFVRGRLSAEEANPINRLARAAYEPAFAAAMRRPGWTIGAALLIALSGLYPAFHLGEEFMPPLDEGDLIYMPTTDPSVSVTKAAELLQQTDKLIVQFPEVVRVHGKVGRADTATDPAPLSMIETTVQLHRDRSQWRQRTVPYFFSDWPSWLKWPLTATLWPESRPITIGELKYGWTDADGTEHPGLNDAIDFPGLANAWPYPIENRLTMLSTGIKTPVGLKIVGPDLAEVGRYAEIAAFALSAIEGTVTAYAEKTYGGFHLDIDIDRLAAGRHGLTTGDVQDVVQAAVGGRRVATVIDGDSRIPVTVRYPRELRDSIVALDQILVATPAGANVPLGNLAEIAIQPSSPMIRSENAQLAAWVFVDIGDRDIGSYVAEAKRVIEQDITLPDGFSLDWSGRYEALEEANRHLRYVVPLVLVLIVVLLYAANRSWFRVAVVLLAVPFSLVGALWFLWWLNFDMSLAVWVGIIALIGVDAETGQVMLLYLQRSCDRFRDVGRLKTPADLFTAIHEGAVKRIRPKAMTVATDMVGLLPLLWASGLGGDVAQRLAAPLIGGIAVSFVVELIVYPVVYYRYELRRLG